MELDFGQKTSLEEAKKNYECNETSAKVIRGIGMAIFQSASFIVSIVAGLQLFPSSASVNQSANEVNILFAIGFLFFVLMILCAYLLLPVKWFTPFPNDYEIISKILFNKTDEEVLAQTLVNYYEAIRMNNISLKRKKIILFIACVLIVIIIFLLLSLVALRIQ